METEAARLAARPLSGTSSGALEPGRGVEVALYLGEVFRHGLRARAAIRPRGPRAPPSPSSLLSSVPAQHASEADPQQEQHLPPHPLVIELPSAAAAPPFEEGLEAVPTDERCASWMLAAEANKNNLVPWRAVPAECVEHVRDYITGVASPTSPIGSRGAGVRRLRARRAARGDGHVVWVFDIRKTLLLQPPLLRRAQIRVSPAGLPTSAFSQTKAGEQRPAVEHVPGGQVGQGTPVSVSATRG